MTRRTWTLSFCSALLLPAGLIAQAAVDQTPTPTTVAPTQRILIHVHSNKPADWQAAMNKANTYMSSARPGTTVVEMLVTGDGLKLIDKDNALKSDVMGSLDKDVSFVACHNSMKANHMTIDQLHAGVGTVPSGGREMAQRKAEGWVMLDDVSAK